MGADAGAEVGDFHGGMCHLGRRFQQLRSCAKCEPGYPRRYLRPRVPAAPRTTHLQHYSSSGEDTEGARDDQKSAKSVMISSCAGKSTPDIPLASASARLFSPQVIDKTILGAELSVRLMRVRKSKPFCGILNLRD